MRVIVEAFGRAFIFQFHQGKVTEVTEDAEEFDRVPVDPHSVSGGQMENAQGQGSVEVQHLSGAGVYTMPEDRKFGFHGS